MAGEEVPEPGEALVEQLIERGTGDPYRKRVTTSGEILEETSTEARFDGNEWHFDPQPLAWRRLGLLDPEEVAELRAAIASSGFMELPAEHRPQGTSIGGSNVTWTASERGRTHAVTLFGAPDVRVPEVGALAAVFERVIGQALDRASRTISPG